MTHLTRHFRQYCYYCYCCCDFLHGGGVDHRMFLGWGYGWQTAFVGESYIRPRWIVLERHEYYRMMFAPNDQRRHRERLGLDFVDLTCLPWLVPIPLPVVGHIRQTHHHHHQQHHHQESDASSMTFALSNMFPAPSLPPPH